MKYYSFLFAAFLLCLNACSDKLLTDHSEDDPAIVLTKAGDGISRVFVTSSFAGSGPDSLLMKVRSKEAYLEVAPGKTRSDLRMTLHYDFETGPDSKSSLELVLPKVNYSITKDSILFQDVSVDGAMNLSGINNDLNYNDATVTGYLTIMKNSLSANLLISGIVKNKDFSIKIDGISNENKDQSKKDAFVENIIPCVLSIENKSEMPLDIELIPDLSGFVNLKSSLKPGEKWQKEMMDYEYERYNRLKISSESIEGTVLKNWYSILPTTKSEDFYIFNNYEAGKIEPLYYSIITFTIDNNLIYSISK